MNNNEARGQSEYLDTIQEEEENTSSSSSNYTSAMDLINLQAPTQDQLLDQIDEDLKYLSELVWPGRGRGNPNLNIVNIRLAVGKV